MGIVVFLVIIAVAWYFFSAHQKASSQKHKPTQRPYEPPDPWTSSETEKTASSNIMLQAKGGAGPPELIAVARSAHAEAARHQDIPIAGISDKEKDKVREIIAVSLSEGQNPRHIYGKVAKTLSPFEWEDFDKWLKRFRKAREWPDMWDDIADYYEGKESGKEVDENELHRVKSEMLAHSLSAWAVTEDKLKDWQTRGIKMIEIAPAPDCCSWCAKYKGKKIRAATLLKKKIPPVHPGCRCGVLPAD
ncbi:MAG: hypothetical protein M0Z71_04720 [Nitrospiraceae bacterium]|nr:hypothetical protein [Nitrospiraceae bacterium]